MAHSRVHQPEQRSSFSRSPILSRRNSESFRSPHETILSDLNAHVIAPEPLSVSIEAAQHVDEICADPIQVPEQHEPSTVNPSSESSSKKPPNHRTDKPQPILRYRRRAFYLLVFYLPFLIIPWILTCVLAVRPLDAPSYVNQGEGLSGKTLLSIYSSISAIRVLNSIAGLATIPVVSALLAQAAVVYCQRRKHNQSLNLGQTFALADRGWWDIQILWGALGWNKEGNGSRFIWFAALLMVISAIQQPLQQLLVTYEEYNVMSCLDNPYFSCDPSHIPIRVGFDPEPGDMALAPQNIVVQEVTNQLPAVNQLSIQPRMWPDHPNVDGDPYDSAADPPNRQTFFWYNGDFSKYNRSYFVTALPGWNTTNTGVLRQHAMRFNSSVQCNLVPRSSFPSICPGARPLTASFSRPDLLDIRVCVPGQYGVFPWTLSRNRQDITEEIFLDVFPPFSQETNTWNDEPYNFTLHCRAQTTRGYFELANWRNNYSYGPLLESWPSEEEMLYDFNDYLGPSADFRPASENDTSIGSTDPYLLDWGTPPADLFLTGGLNVSGPLMTSAIAIFGNQSFFYIAANSSNTTSPSAMAQICQQGNIPFSRFGAQYVETGQGLCSYVNFSRPETSDDSELARMLNYWSYGFNDTDVAEEYLSVSMFLASQSILTQTVDATYDQFGARTIYTAPGVPIFRPIKTLAGTIIVSLLIFFQLAGLLYLAWYIYQVPTWTASLDASAVAQIGAAIGHSSFPSIGPVHEKDRAKLKNTSGLIGVVEDQANAEDDLSDRAILKATGADAGTSNRNVTLGLGATGVISRKLVLSKKKNKKEKSNSEP